MVKRKICVFTGTRAEYGLLKPLLDLLKKDKSFQLQILVSGAHLSQEFGLTYKEIEKDGFIINAKVDMQLKTDSAKGITRSMGIGLIGFGEAFSKLRPDILVLLGDRYEALTVAVAAMIFQIPIAHINGGEATYGLIDEAIRHSITKMSHLHFVSTEQYRKRVIQLGESPRSVFNVGSIGLDNIHNLKLLTRQELINNLGIQFNQRNLLVTFHPVTLEKSTAQQQFQILLDVLDELKNTSIVFTKANADTDGRIINKMIDAYFAKNKHKVWAFTSLGQLKYLSLMQYVDAAVGNSSSGIIEAPSFKIGTINIGDRQKGRIRTSSIIDCEPVKSSINASLKKLYSKEFQRKLKRVKSPYGRGDTALIIMRKLKDFNFKELIKKKFYDI